MATRVHQGRTVDYTPSSAVSAGDVIVQETLVGVADNDIAADELGAISVEGVYDFPKATGGGTDAPAGTKYYWDATAGVVEEATSSDNVYLGKSVAACTTTDTTVRIRLEQ